MSILTFSEYSRDFHQTLRNIWISEGHDKRGFPLPPWIRFKINQYNFYLRESGIGLDFTGWDDVLDRDSLKYNPDITKEMVVEKIDKRVISALNYNQKKIPVWTLIRRLSKK